MKAIYYIKKAFAPLGVALLAGFVSMSAYAAGDTSLNRLEIKVDGSNVVTGFNPATLNYDVTLDKMPATATVSAAPASPAATVVFSVGEESFSNHSVIALNGATTVSCRVSEGESQSTYVVNVAKAVVESRTVHFKGGWSATPYAYIYTGGTPSTEPHGAWPGTLMTESSPEGWYTITLDEAADKESRVIFNTNGGSERYPADQVPGIPLNFEGNDGWYLLSDKTWYTSNPEGPQKPVIEVTPAAGKVRGTTVIGINITNEATSISGSFNGTALNLANGYNSITVSDYLADGSEGTMTITATNSVGTAEFSATYNRDDTVPPSTLTGDWRELSIYQIMVGSFQHSDSGAPGYTDMWGPVGHRKDGNIKGITEALDYIKDLGMNAIWLTPVFDSSNGVYNDDENREKLPATGYYANDYFTIDPHFGTADEFRELVREAHRRNIYVILDGVFGHHNNCTGASPNGNYIDNRTAANVRNSSPGNVSYPGSLDYFKEVVKYWMNEYQVDGWRLDQCYQVYQGGYNYWKDLRLEVEAVAQDRKNRGEQWGTLGYMVGEDWDTAANIVVTQQDGLKSVMDFDGMSNLVNLGYGVGSIGWFLSTDAKGRGYKDDGVNPTIFLSNHDTARVGDFVDVETSPEKLMTRHAAVAAYSGPAITYYGDEIGDKSGNGNEDNKARTSGRITGFNANEQRVHDFVAKVFKARGENPALWRGTVARQQMNNNTEILTKTDEVTGNKVICIFSSVDATVSIAGTGENLLEGGTVNGTVSVKAWVPVFVRMD